jgi:cytochrome c oxidase subunit 2
MGARPRAGGRYARRAALALGLLCLGLTGCATTLQDSLSPAGEFARKADHLFGYVFIIVVLVFVLVEGAIVAFMFKYRERPNSPAPVQIHGHTRAEVIWTLIPAVILAGVAVPTVKLIFDFAAAPPAADRVDVTVTGHQWWWQYEYKTGATSTVTTANELHIPVHKPVYVTLKSVDVIHAFWVPRLQGKQDVVPGHTNHMTIEADNPGTYSGQCSQFCGLSHANMRLLVFAETDSDFSTWLSAQAEPAATPTDPQAQQGADLFLHGRGGSGVFGDKSKLACASCHTIGGVQGAVGVTGPNLTHVYSRHAFAGDTITLSAENLRAWLKDPPALKPGADMPNLGLTDDEINSLLAYLQTLR